MGRRRLKPTGFHHVMTRTAQGVFWLEEPQVKEIFNDLVDFYIQVYYIEDLARNCMSNHTHLVLEVSQPEIDIDDLRRRYELAQTRLVKPRPFRKEMAENIYKKYTDLSWFMWEINRRMAVLYNEMKGTRGHLWGARFKNVVVEPGENLLRVIAYVELNSVRAGMVEDPSDFPYSSVGRIKEQQEQGKKPKVPQIPLLEKLPEETRAKTYVDFMRYVAIAQTEPDLRLQPLPIHFTRHGIEVNLEAMCEALESREPGNWSNLIYGSAEFAEKTLIGAGWLVPMKKPEEVGQKAPLEAA
ncbi:MAG: hypothetical protein GY807_06975 [Gammaproteobacteria bacterium]|nr:hypothetical protein [Gammaproteobacteria bacterium]